MTYTLIKKRISVFLILVMLLSWICYGLFRRYHLDKYYKLTTGQINHISIGGYKNKNRDVHYEYYINGRRLFGDNEILNCNNYTTLDLSRLIVNRKFFVAYDSIYTNQSIIILTEKQAKRFHVPITDTLLHYDSIINCKQAYDNY